MIRIRNIYDDVGLPNPNVGYVEYSEVERVESYIKELERKLKIAEDALTRIRDNTEDNLIAAIADDILNPKFVVLSNDNSALKQIRGEP